MRMERGNKQCVAQGGQGELSSGEEQQINAACCLCSENRPCSEAGKVRGRPCKAARGAPPNPWWRCVGLRGARCKAGEVKAAALPEGGLQPSASFPPQLLVCFCGTRQEQQRAASVCTARGFLGVLPPPLLTPSSGSFSRACCAGAAWSEGFCCFGSLACLAVVS